MDRVEQLAGIVTEKDGLHVGLVFRQEPLGEEHPEIRRVLYMFEGVPNHYAIVEPGSTPRTKALLDKFLKSEALRVKKLLKKAGGAQ